MDGRVPMVGHMPGPHSPRLGTWLGVLLSLLGLVAGTGSPCQDSERGTVNWEGSNCSWYTSNPRWCGGGDDDDFSSESMCCACGGGQWPPRCVLNGTADLAYNVSGCSDELGGTEGGHTLSFFFREPPPLPTCELPPPQRVACTYVDYWTPPVVALGTLGLLAPGLLAVGLVVVGCRALYLAARRVLCARPDELDEHASRAIESAYVDGEQEAKQTASSRPHSLL